MAFRLANRDKLLAPRKCLICETHPSHRCVDTGYNLTASTVFDKLRGRKYVCEGCGEKIGKALGMLVQAQVTKLKDEIIALQNRNAELDDMVALGKQIEGLAAYFNQEASNRAIPGDPDVEV